MVFPERVCCITSFHDTVPGEVVRVTMITTDMLHRDKIVFHREWWASDMDLGDIHDEIDFLVGLLRTSCPSAYIMHVSGTAQLTKHAAGGYLSSYVSKRDLLTLLRDEPEKFV